ncbi:MAG: aromatic ring-hydroxylating dioxygenase subunit alpha [Candidatus Melainabacteria bacterium]|nr:aromatic ring-hydroxylating dioxygenase subunit alpha [Candidatus Melainabacteria bacterium]
MVKTGELIKDQWYAVYLARDLAKAGTPVSLRRLGEDLVLWRDSHNRPRLAPAACPHRGADLSLGWVEQGSLRCKYHGFCFNNQGRCTAIPCQGKAMRIPESLDLSIIESREAHGYIWMWYGDGAAEGEPRAPRCLDGYSGEVTFQTVWDIRFSRVMEGMMDMHHIPFAHRPWISSRITRLDPYEVSQEDEGIIRTRGTMRDESNPRSKGLSMEIDVAFPGMLCFTLGQGGSSDLAALVACTPVDEENTWIASRYCQALIRIPFIDSLFTWLTLQADLKVIQPDDYALLKSTRPRSSRSGTSHLVAADRGIAAWHSLKEQKEPHAQTEVRQIR